MGLRMSEAMSESRSRADHVQITVSLSSNHQRQNTHYTITCVRVDDDPWILDLCHGIKVEQKILLFRDFK